jgi:hypothetical protein
MKPGSIVVRACGRVGVGAKEARERKHVTCIGCVRWERGCEGRASLGGGWAGLWRRLLSDVGQSAIGSGWDGCDCGGRCGCLGEKRVNDGGRCSRSAFRVGGGEGSGWRADLGVCVYIAGEAGVDDDMVDRLDAACGSWLRGSPETCRGDTKGDRNPTRSGRALGPCAFPVASAGTYEGVRQIRVRFFGPIFSFILGLDVAWVGG